MPKFETKQQIIVPGHGVTQGVVLDFTETLPGFPVYTIRYLSVEGEPLTGTCGEGDLADANRTDEQLMQSAIEADEEAKRIDSAIQHQVDIQVADRLAHIRAKRRKRNKIKAAPKRKR